MGVESPNFSYFTDFGFFKADELTELLEQLTFFWYITRNLLFSSVGSKEGPKIYIISFLGKVNLLPNALLHEIKGEW